jgi:hypothetical protein
VIDASGTIDSPGVLGASGIPALGERAAADRIFYGIPDVLGALRDRYAGRRVLVVGSGHSALNAILDLAQLAEVYPATKILWAIRRPVLGHLLGGARNDQLPERGKLGSRTRSLLDEGIVELMAGFHIDRLTLTADGIVAKSGSRAAPAVDEIIAATGFRPDSSLLSEVRLDLDPAVQSPRVLAPLIDPNVHSCGTVRPHGAEELKQPDGSLFVIGMKSYGRAPTFLMLTGYEQARSVVSAIAGDWEAARRVELVLPETGVCSTDLSGVAGSRTSACRDRWSVGEKANVGRCRPDAFAVLVPLALVGAADDDTRLSRARDWPVHQLGRVVLRVRSAGGATPARPRRRHVGRDGRILAGDADVGGDGASHWTVG